MTVLITSVIGALFLLSWTQTRSTRALLWWGFGELVAAAAIALVGLRGVAPDALSIGAANALLLSAYGMLWTGVRAFEGRAVPIWLAAAGVVIWLAACGVPGFLDNTGARVAVSSGLAGTYSFIAAAELWRGRGEFLVSRYPAIALLAMHGVLYLGRLPLLAIAPPTWTSPFEAPWFTVLAFEAVLHTVAIAFLFMALTKERAEERQKAISLTDALTGVPNRRALMGDGARMLHDHTRHYALVLFDLDHFKRVNDEYGHAVGDAVLVAFCHVAQELSPPGSVFGRMGGEEFACLFPESEPPSAASVPEAIRSAFATVTKQVIPTLCSTVSAGVATTRECGRDFDVLLWRADQALYGAKALGRDNVHVFQLRERLLDPAPQRRLQRDAA